jgi:2'-5' RNA ligase
MARLFFANKPALETRFAIHDMAGRLISARGLKGHRMDPGRLHLTLASAVALHMSLQEAIWRAQMLAAAMRGAPMPVTLQISASFRSGARRPFVLRGERLAELAAFRARLRGAMQGCGFPVASHFTPHVTLIWADRCVEEAPVAPVSWMIEDFELVLSADGDHIQLGRWPLTW